VRLHFLQALARPLEDIEFANRKLDQFRRPAAVLRAIEANADRPERVLEAVSLGIALIEVCMRANEEEDEP
jgi:hypothetical protein